MKEISFESCFKLGHDTEIHVANKFLEDEWLVNLNSCKSRHDLWVFNKSPFLIEVKNEDEYSESGNICIELYQGKNNIKPSGLKTSESTIYIHTLKEKVVLYRTQYMRLYIAERWHQLKCLQENFKNADNGNGGLVLAINNFINFSWFDYLDFKNLTKSKIFRRE